MSSSEYSDVVVQDSSVLKSDEFDFDLMKVCFWGDIDRDETRERRLLDVAAKSFGFTPRLARRSPPEADYTDRRVSTGRM